MNFYKLFVLLAVILAWSSCKNDDDDAPSCAQTDWVGTYEGTITCDGTTEDVTVTITASGTDAIVITHETSTVMTEYDPLTPDVCDLDVSNSVGGITISVDADLNGNNLTFSETFSDGSTSSTCNITATRQ